jgi:hypothetical protein
MATKKYLSEDGVRRLWAAIEAKFIDGDEIAEMLAEVQPGEEMVAMTNEDIDAVTGYVAPVVDPETQTDP